MKGWDGGLIAEALVGWYLALSYAKQPEDTASLALAVVSVTVGVLLVAMASYRAGMGAKR